jgi:endonuclease/exonuclease/phosphatase family metal-dependent hydrolase
MNLKRPATMAKRVRERVVLELSPEWAEGRPVKVTMAHMRTLWRFAQDRSVEQLAEEEGLSVAGVRKRLSFLCRAFMVQSVLAVYHRLVLAGEIDRNSQF